MRVLLKGVHKVRYKTKSGAIAHYYYAWRGGPRIEAEPGTAAFIAAYQAAHANKRAPAGNTFRDLIAGYKASSEFTSLKHVTRSTYLRYIALIEDEFGTLPIEALADIRIRGEFKSWRDRMGDQPRKADLAWSVLARILSVAHDHGKIASNPCERGGRLYRSDRREAVWGEADIARFLEHAPEHMAHALILAIWTGQRQGDLLRLTWSAYDGTHLSIRQSKTGARVHIPVTVELRTLLDRLRRAADESAEAVAAVTVLTNSRGRPWTADGFKTTWGRSATKAGIEGLTFHDLRGSAVVRLARAGCSIPEIAAITGHSPQHAAAILNAHYLSPDQHLAESAILKLERAFGPLQVHPKTLK